MQIRDQLITTEKLEKQIKVLEKRKEQAVYTEVQQKKIKDGVRKESEKVKEEKNRNKEHIVEQSMIELQIKKAKVDAIQKSKGRGIQVKENLVQEVQKAVADSEENKKNEHIQKLQIQNSQVVSLEEVEQQMMKKLKNT